MAEAGLYISPLEDYSAFLGFNRDRKKTPFTIIGIPLDISSSYRSGCSLAPQSIRNTSRSIELCSFVNNINLEDIGFEDLGNIIMAPGDIITSLKRIEIVIESLLNEGRRIFILGGEHTLTYGSFKAFAKIFKNPCLLVFDAHLDLRDEYLGTKFNHATVIRRIIDDTNVLKVIFIGSRAISMEESSYALEKNDKVSIYRFWGSRIPIDIIDRVREDISRCDAIYISIDMDVIDPAYAPGVQTPEPLGIDPQNLLQILSRLIDTRTWVTDIVEITPVYDHSETTSFLASRIIIEIASILIESLNIEKSYCKI
ncbi:agmatinase [Ignisphaera aggregans DSM 17230]|uniref:Agmatinase n=1 Tax=Ignisphaera aggregans (strain DSM 17230 / JCM 13409 / AQ1.S1) TaxID=583356 RepID=E0SQ53_IGNAA|nr:agmatinase [Ignisphaera aggregans DSM 17230]